MNLGVIGAIVRKDLVALTRDQFYLFISVIGLIAVVAMYWFLQSGVDETVRLGVYHSDLDTVLSPLTAIETEALAIERYDSPEALAVAVEEGTAGIVAGMAFSDDFVAQAQTGSASVDLLVPAGLPPEYAELMNGLAAQVGYFVSGTTPPVDVTTRLVVLGTDRVGDQVSMQEQMLPLLAFFVLMMETLRGVDRR